ncbi:MAG: hypothetical protein WA817_08450 [Candidatus Acidiferrum sp.]
MEVTLKIPDELLAEAKSRGLPIEDYIHQILVKQLPSPPEDTSRPRTPEQIRAWLDSLAQFSDKIPPLPEEISRDWIYQDHN